VASAAPEPWPTGVMASATRQGVGFRVSIDGEVAATNLSH